MDSQHHRLFFSGKGLKIPGRSALFLFFCSFMLATPALAGNERIIFLHHSTGNIIYTDGNVSGWIADYNATHNSSYVIEDRYYPTTPYPWANYPYDYWNLWVNGTCRADNPNIHCLDQLTADFQVVIFKNCFPVSNIEADTGSPDITSSRKSLENYKLQYAAVRDKLQQYPNTLFIFWTGAPLHRLATTPEKADRARQFATWVKNEMLTGGTYPNIRVFDYFDLTAGADNMLRYEYEKSHTGSDSHPNTLAATDVGPVFAQFIIDSAQDFFDSTGGGQGSSWTPPLPEAKTPVPATALLLMN
ncbi:MAG TPA: hypothetical protein ENI88_09190 [Desulfobulbus sp.]|nr:hypothetical protein [Desulfobulbus sp.]